MKKVLFLVATLLMPGFSEAEVLRVTVESVSLRNQPATSGGVVTTVTRGTLLEVVEKDGYWNRVRVQSTGEIGYVHSAFVEVAAAPAAEKPRAVRNPSPAPSEPAPAPEHTSSTRSQPRQTETGPSDAGPFGLGGYLWGGNSSVALSPIVDLGEHASLLGTFETWSIFGIRNYEVTGNLLIRFPVGGNSSPVSFEPYVGGGVAYRATTYADNFDPNFHSDSSTMGFTILGGTFLKFESVPHLKLSGGLIHFELWGGDDLNFANPQSYGGTTLMVGAHYFF